MTSPSVRRRLSGPLLLLGAALALPAAATTVSGTLTITPELGQNADAPGADQTGPPQHFWRIPNGAVATVPPPVDPARDLAVIMEPTSGQAAAPASKTVTVHLRGAGLDPAVIAVPVRTKIRFENNDPFLYELECEQNSAMAGSGIIPPGRGVPYSFDEPGTYEITDRRMPHVKGYIIVVETPFVATPTPAESPGGASFSFAEVQAGQYRVKVAHHNEWIAEQMVEVAEEQEEVGVQIRLPSDQQQHDQAETETTD